MTELLSDVDTPSDAELISRVRGGDVAAYGDLFSRHQAAAHRLARQLVRGPDSDDLVSEAFAKVLVVLQGGGGPDVAFRAYLLTAVRRLHVDRVRAGQRLHTTDDLTPFDPGVPFQDTAVAGFENGAAAKAFASLPERWQLVLWHLEVEGQKPADIAPLLGMSPNSVSALAYRAREGLRQAFLTMHISDLTDTDCRWVNEHLGAFIRSGLSKRDSGKVQQHLDGCRRCTAMYLELNEVNSNLAAIIGPLLLGAAATGYLASSGAGAAGVVGLLSRVKDFVAANSVAVTAAGVAAGVATAAAVAAVTLGGGGAAPQDVVADPPASVTTPAAPGTTAPPTSPAKSPTEAVAPTTAPVVPSTTTPQAPAAPVTDLSNEVPTLPGSSGAPDEPATATDGATDTGTGTDVPAPSSVDLSGTTVDEDGVHFRATGSPLPPTMTVRLTSNPSGVNFGPSPDCAVSPDGGAATCSTVSGAGARTPGTAAMAASTYSAELPFLIPDAQLDTDIDITVDVPAGFEVAGGTGTFKPYTSKTADVRMTLPAGVPFAPGGSSVAAQLAGLPSGYAGPVRLSLVDGAATFAGTTTDGCALDAGVVTCRQPADGLVGLTVVPSDPAVDTPVRIRVAPVTGYRDPATGNNTASTTLAAQPVVVPPAADLGLTLDGPVPADSDSGYTVTGHVTGLPAGYAGTVTYTLSGASATFTSTGCTPLGQTLLCPAPAAGTVVLDVDAADTSVDNPVTVTVAKIDGYDDTDLTNNAATTTLQAVVVAPPATDVDVALTGLGPATVRPDAGDTYALSGALSVTGPAAALVQDVTYTVTGARFVEGGTPTSTVTRPASDTTPGFTLTHQGAGTATITAAATGYVETDASDNAGSVNLAPYDVALGPLTASSPTANQNGDQQLTATLDRDGFTGSIAFTMPRAPGDLTLTGSSVSGTVVTFTVHSAQKDLSPAAFEIRADLPAAYTDYDTADNSRGSTYTYAGTPFALSSATASERVGGEWTVNATVTGVPQGATVTFGLTNPAEFVSATGCVISDSNHTLTCAPGSAGAFTVTFRAKLPGAQNQQHGTLTAGVVGDPTRTASTTITD